MNGLARRRSAVVWLAAAFVVGAAAEVVRGTIDRLGTASVAPVRQPGVGIDPIRITSVGDGGPWTPVGEPAGGDGAATPAPSTCFVSQSIDVYATPDAVRWACYRYPDRPVGKDQTSAEDLAAGFGLASKPGQWADDGGQWTPAGN